MPQASSLDRLSRSRSRSTHAGDAPLGRSAIWRYNALVITEDGRDLNALLVSNGLARIYGTRTPLPDRRDSREYLARLRQLENEAKAAKRGAWGKLDAFPDPVTVRRSR